MENLTGKHAFVTGGASGIGLALAHAFLNEGALVTIADFDQQRLDAIEAPFTKIALDVRDRASWSAAKAAAEASNGPVAILCNNAGIGPDRTELAETDPDIFDRMIAIKLTGAFNGIHAFAADMRSRGEGHIVNTASMAGLEAGGARMGAYASAKFGLVGMSEVLRAEMEPHGVGVSVLCPGMVATGLPATLAKANGKFEPAMEEWVMPGISADRVALRVVEGIKGNWPYILTHGERRDAVAERHAAIMAAFDDTPHSSAL